MMRYLYTIGLLLISMGLPLLAAAPTAKPTPSTSSKASAHYVVPSTPAKEQTSTAAAKKSDDKKPFLVIAPNGLHNSCSVSSAAKNATIRAVSTLENATSRLARVTAYWATEGDYYTRRLISATGVRLHDGHCAVDPNIIPYGSVVEIAGVGKFLAVDTGSAVVSRTAAREGGHNSTERSAIVIDLFFASRAEGEKFAASEAKYLPITWWTPGSRQSQARVARAGLFAEEDWSKIESKQL